MVAGLQNPCGHLFTRNVELRLLKPGRNGNALRQAQHGVLRGPQRQACIGVQHVLVRNIDIKAAVGVFCVRHVEQNEVLRSAAHSLELVALVFIGEPFKTIRDLHAVERRPQIPALAGNGHFRDRFFRLWFRFALGGTGTLATTAAAAAASAIVGYDRQRRAAAGGGKNRLAALAVAKAQKLVYAERNCAAARADGFESDRVAQSFGRAVTEAHNGDAAGAAAGAVARDELEYAGVIGEVGVNRAQSLVAAAESSRYRHCGAHRHRARTEGDRCACGGRWNCEQADQKCAGGQKD